MDESSSIFSGISKINNYSWKKEHEVIFGIFKKRRIQKMINHSKRVDDLRSMKINLNILPIDI